MVWSRWVGLRENNVNITYLFRTFYQGRCVPSARWLNRQVLLVFFKTKPWFHVEASILIVGVTHVTGIRLWRCNIAKWCQEAPSPLPPSLIFDTFTGSTEIETDWITDQTKAWGLIFIKETGYSNFLVFQSLLPYNWEYFKNGSSISIVGFLASHTHQPTALPLSFWPIQREDRLRHFHWVGSRRINVFIWAKSWKSRPSQWQ